MCLYSKRASKYQKTELLSAFRSRPVYIIHPCMLGQSKLLFADWWFNSVSLTPAPPPHQTCTIWISWVELQLWPPAGKKMCKFTSQDSMSGWCHTHQLPTKWQHWEVNVIQYLLPTKISSQLVANNYVVALVSGANGGGGAIKKCLKTDMTQSTTCK